MWDFEKKRERAQEINKLYNSPKNRRLQVIASVAIALGIILLAVAAIFIDRLSWKMILFLRGCGGLCAIVFVVATAIAIYRANSQYMRNRWDPTRRKPK